MRSAASPTALDGSNARDELDGIVDNYDQAVEDFLRDLPMRDEGSTNADNAPAQTQRDVDEEIKVRKKRAPVAKLDQARLLSDAGIPKLMRIAKTRLNFKGKGHEFRDVEKLLAMYQFWLDDLYPRAKFRDALAVVEKLGHSKSMQVRRKAWIDATKPNRQDDFERVGDAEDVTASGAFDSRVEQQAQHRDKDDDNEGEHSFGDVDIERQLPDKDMAPAEVHVEDNDVPEGDELDALLAQEANIDGG